MWSTNHRACKGNKKTTGGPREDAARPGTIIEFGDTTGASGEQLPHLPALVRTWACRRRGHEAGRSEPGDRGAAGGPGAQLSAAFFRASGQAPLRERTPGIHERPGDPCAVRRRRHTATPSRGGKTGKCGPRTPRGTPSLSWPPAEPQATGRNLRIAIQLLETARSHHASLTSKSSGSRMRLGPEMGPRRPRQLALRARTRMGWPSLRAWSAGTPEGR